MNTLFSADDFIPVDISEFLVSKKTSPRAAGREIAIFTPDEQKLIDTLMEIVQTRAADRIDIFSRRIRDLKRLAAAIARFPPLLERHDLTGGVRTPQLLIESLIKHQDNGDTTVQLPSKAILGKGFLIAKIHTFSSLTKLSERIAAPEELTAALYAETSTLMFSLLAEDVYLNLICDTEQPMEFRHEWALSLLLLWEHWIDQTIALVAPVLQAVWNARRQLAPAFGTMMGTSELLLISIQLDNQWADFIKEKLSDEMFLQAMEEFLFGISYEQIQRLRAILRKKGIPAIGRDEVATYLNEHIKTNASLDYRDFYALYTVRRDNARARSRMKLPGPHKTLEDYFIQFTTKKNKEKQNNDVFI